MPKTTLAKTGLNKNDFGDIEWFQDLRDGFDELERRIQKTNAGNPNGAISGDWYGQPCWDSTNNVLYECVLKGNAQTAKWQVREAVPTGMVTEGIRTSVPSGWLPFDGVARLQTDYPKLAAVLPTWMKSVGNFTLPLLDDVPSYSVGNVSDPNLGKIIGGYPVSGGKYAAETGPPGNTVTVQSGTGATVASSVHSHDMVPNFRRFVTVRFVKF